MHYMRGLSLIEVIAALAVIAVLAGVALPALADARARAQFARAELDLGGSVLLANRIAVASAAAVILCPAAAAGGCEAGSDWSRGWLAFADIDGDRRFGAYDVQLQRSGGYGEDIVVVSNAGRGRAVFQPDGDSAGSNLSFVVCSRSRPRGLRLALSNGGRLRQAQVAPEQIEACRRGSAL
ncbi:GspH/FimT family protein [Lysobacter enzymogenes]|uniref:GspH/FimT family protein n=1 Tax=Lysobacter enzymogenes TaxID=69 RepID=UPI00384A6BCF